MAPGGFYHCLISYSLNAENICWIIPTESDVLGRVMEGVLRGYFSRRIRLIRLEDPSDVLDTSPTRPAPKITVYITCKISTKLSFAIFFLQTNIYV